MHSLIARVLSRFQFLRKSTVFERDSHPIHFKMKRAQMDNFYPLNRDLSH